MREQEKEETTALREQVNEEFGLVLGFGQALPRTNLSLEQGTKTRLGNQIHRNMYN